MAYSDCQTTTRGAGLLELQAKGLVNLNLFQKLNVSQMLHGQGCCVGCGTNRHLTWMDFCFATMVWERRSAARDGTALRRGVLRDLPENVLCRGRIATLNSIVQAWRLEHHGSASGKSPPPSRRSQIGGGRSKVRTAEKVFCS